MAAIRQQDWQQACLDLKVNWPGTVNDGRTVAQRFDITSSSMATQEELDAALARIQALEAQVATIAIGNSEASVLLRLGAVEEVIKSMQPRLWKEE